MFRGCFTLILGILLGAGTMLYLWPRPPDGVSPPASSDVRVFVSDRYLAQAVAQRLSTVTLPSVSNVHVASDPPNSLVVSMRLSAGPLSAPAALQVAPSVENGQVRTNFVASQVAGIPIPSQLGGFVTNAINSRTDALLHGSVTVTGIRVEPTGLEIWANNP